MAFKYFSEKTHAGILAMIRKYAKERVRSGDEEKVKISSLAYANAFAEADFDASFAKVRRGLDAGISEGKLAGILYYRLTRHCIVHLDSDITDTSYYQDFQEKLMIIIIGSLMNVNFNDPWIQKLEGTPRAKGMKLDFQDIHGELRYFTSKRHYNQESLALFFDTWSYLGHAIDTLRKHNLA